MILTYTAQPTLSVMPIALADSQVPITFVTADSPIQRAAIELFDLGFNIAPTKPGDKVAHLWRILTGTRIDRRYLMPIFDNGAGILVLLGRLSMNLTILDCDTIAATDHHAQEFERRDLKVWRVNTARGAHFWWLSADGEIANHHGEGYEIRGNTCYCLCPPSIHPTGMIYEWADRQGVLPPTIPITALDWLPLKLASQRRRKFDPTSIDSDPLACLSKNNQDFIKCGASEGTRNIRLFAAACDMAGNDFSMSEAIATLTPSAQAAGLSYSEIASTIKKAYAQKRTPAKPTKRSKPLPTWARAQRWGASHHWQSLRGENATVTAQTARDVFMALCERSRRDSADVFRASERETSELANTDRTTANRAIVCLVSAGVLKSCGKTKSGAALFAFSNLVLHETASNITGSVISGIFCNTYSDTRADVFRRGALGKTAERVWMATLPPNSPATKAEIARQAKCNRSTVTRLLSDDGLPKWGLVSRLDSGLWIGNPADDRYLQEVSVKSGTSGKAAKRKALHAAERAKYASEKILRVKRGWEKIHLNSQGSIST